MVNVEELLKRQPPETTVQQVAGKVRCTKCGRKGHLDLRLDWKCGQGLCRSASETFDSY